LNLFALTHLSLRNRELVRLHGRKWVLVGEKLGRAALSCRDKYRLVGDDDTFKEGPWTVDEDRRLIELVCSHVNINLEADSVVHTAATNGTNELTAVPWTSVSARMGTRSHSQCRVRYQKLILVLRERYDQMQRHQALTTSLASALSAAEQSVFNFAEIPQPASRESSTSPTSPTLASLFALMTPSASMAPVPLAPEHFRLAQDDLTWFGHSS
jgi:hypothetical protein